MRILDKYLLRQFMIPLGFCLTTFSMIFVIGDLFEHLSDFIDARTSLCQILRYYAYLLPALLVYIAPISLLLGVLYSLWRLTRNSELVAMRACGINFYRIVIPFILVGFGFSVLVSTVQEWVAPWSSYWAAQFVARQGDEDGASTRFAQDLSFRNERHGRIWVVRKFNLDDYSMQGVKLLQEFPDGSVETIHAEDARYYDGRWWFFNLSTQKRDAHNNPVGPTRSDLIMEMTDLTEKPRDFANVVKDPVFLSASELYEFQQTHKQLSDKTRARFLVDMHSRLSMPWTCFIVVLFGVPCGVYTGRRGVFVGIIVALCSFFGFYLLMTLCQWLGKNEMITPIWSAWLPNLCFLSVGGWLMIRAR
jgi:lipopolysaccharide export system permease protein